MAMAKRDEWIRDNYSEHFTNRGQRRIPLKRIDNNQLSQKPHKSQSENKQRNRNNKNTVSIIVF